MIGRLSGVIAEKTPPQVVIDVGGVGYEVDVPMSTFFNLPALGERASLLTHLSIREDAHVLFGFLTAEERNTFRLLIKMGNSLGGSVREFASTAKACLRGVDQVILDASFDDRIPLILLNLEAAIVIVDFFECRILFGFSIHHFACGLQAGIHHRLREGTQFDATFEQTCQCLRIAHIVIGGEPLPELIPDFPEIR